tara:strand:+ start:67212 stop:67394 length:183 start_codon:yes stop_codon:yes gene_type:complete
MELDIAVDDVADKHTKETKVEETKAERKARMKTMLEQSIKQWEDEVESHSLENYSLDLES